MSEIPTIACFTLFVAFVAGLAFHLARLSRESHAKLTAARKEFTKVIESCVTNCERNPPHAFFYAYDSDVTRALAAFREALPPRKHKKFDLLTQEYEKIDRLKMMPAHRRHDCDRDYPTMSDDEARPIVLKSLNALLSYAKKA